MVQGFPKKTPFSQNLKSIPNLLSNEKEGKIVENNDFSYFTKRESFMVNAVDACKSAD